MKTKYPIRRIKAIEEATDKVKRDKYHFSKVLADYYIKWFQDCHKSAIYCRANNDEARAAQYLNDASRYLTIIMENWDAIEYFTNNPDKAFIYDILLPKEFQGYE